MLSITTCKHDHRTTLRVYGAEENAQRPEYRKCAIHMVLQRNNYIDEEAILSIC